MEYEIMCKFPLLSFSEDLTKWTGFISTKTEANLISLVVPKFPSCSELYLDTTDLEDWVADFWTPILKTIRTEDEDSGTELSFLEYLNTLEAQLLSKNAQECRPKQDSAESLQIASNLYSAVMEDIEAIGVDRVTSLSKDFKELTITNVDKSQREHQLRIIIPPTYPATKPKVIAELPVQQDFMWPMRIADVSHLFLTCLDKYCKFWDEMEDLDGRVKVIDPLVPLRSHIHRKILLENNVIIHLSFNPLLPRSLPQITFSGPDTFVAELNAALDQDCRLWDESASVIQNLRSMLECEFVLPQSVEEDFNGDQAPCTVCYVYNFEDEIPEENCGGCGASFHRQCLYDLFVSDGSKTGLRRCVECPNCQMEIRVPAGVGGAGW